MAKLEAGEFELQIEAVPVDEIVQASLAHCRSALSGRPVKLQISSELPAVRADLERAKEAMVQLIDNANLYSPKIGRSRSLPI